MMHMDDMPLSNEVRRHKQEGMSLLPPPVEVLRTTVVLPKALVEALDRISTETRKSHPPNGLTRQQVIQSFLEASVRQYDEDKKNAKR